MIAKQKFLITYIIVEYFISLCSSQLASNLQLIKDCSKWNNSAKSILFGKGNGTAGDDDYSLNLTNSSLGINRQTGEIVVLDDNNHRVLVFNLSNASTLFAIVSDSSNLTNKSMIRYSPSAITYDHNNSIYILDEWKKQIMKMNNPLQYGENATLMTKTILSSASLPFDGTAVGLCPDDTGKNVFISDYDNHQIIRYHINMSTSEVYVGTGTAGNTYNQLNHPTSIVIDDNRTLFVNDAGNNRIQMFKYNSTNGTRLAANISGCIGISLYGLDILVMNTKSAVYLFNLTNNETRCVLGCNSSELSDTHNALIDNNGNLIVTDSNQVLSYSIYEECSDTSSNFFPINNCPNGTFGINCSSSSSICDISRPCFNSGTCTENKTNKNGYNCECVWGVQGINCEDDQRPCKPFTCFQRGHCINKSMEEFECNCNDGYEGERCEKTVSYCANVTCQNRGVCFPQYLNYTCNCLTGFNGRHCEISDTSTIIRTYVSKSCAYIAILMLAMVVAFIVIMDVLKYGFDIDPVKSDRDAVQKKQKKRIKKKAKVKPPKVAYRFEYVN